jgi:hypothetical protein
MLLSPDANPTAMRRLAAMVGRKALSLIPDADLALIGSVEVALRHANGEATDAELAAAHAAARKATPLAWYEADSVRLWASAAVRSATWPHPYGAAYHATGDYATAMWWAAPRDRHIWKDAQAAVDAAWAEMDAAWDEITRAN